MRVEPSTVESVAKELYIRALKILPPDIKRGFGRSPRERNRVDRRSGVLAR